MGITYSAGNSESRFNQFQTCCCLTGRSISSLSFRAISAWPSTILTASMSAAFGSMGADDTQPSLSWQQPLLLAPAQLELYVTKMTYGQRLGEAMKGKYRTNAELAKALTERLWKQGRLPRSRDIPPETIQSARNRTESSKYTLDFALLCDVNCYWLAFEEGEMRSAIVFAPNDVVGMRLWKLWPTLADETRLACLEPALRQPLNPNTTTSSDNEKKARSS